VQIKEGLLSLSTALPPEIIMASWNSDAIINIVFIPLYFLLIPINIFNCVKHGVRREGAYVCLLVVSLCTRPIDVRLISENRRRHPIRDFLDGKFDKH
jgi:hypothetical protein